MPHNPDEASESMEPDIGPEISLVASAGSYGSNWLVNPKKQKRNSALVRCRHLMWIGLNQDELC